MPTKENHPAPLDYPELIVALAGPIGVDLDLVARAVGSALGDVGYESCVIKLTDEMERFPLNDPALEREVQKNPGTDLFNMYMRKMTAANALRKKYDDAAVLARIAIDTIRDRRAPNIGDDPANVKSKYAYIVRQLKRPEEVALLRQVYGRQFVLVSTYAPAKDRKDFLCAKMRQELSTSTKEIQLGFNADRLMDRDAREDNEELGQQLRDTFHLADVFIDGVNKVDMDAKLGRFFAALFGRNDISPSKDEFGMYAAKSASLRSADLSRQVGAAIFSSEGDLITQGCNEVPKAHGGTYWDLEEPDYRDIKKGYDPNERFTREILREMVERFRDDRLLGRTALKLGNDNQIVEHLIAKRKAPRRNGALVGARILDLTEYSRVVHAEMLAVCDAARLGRSVRGATLYCTTFPCHNCTKHLLASGIRRVVYLEPYPKSRAKDLHPDEVELESEDPKKLSFVPFMGISPFRYRDLFQKGRRKDDRGNARAWYFDNRRPMLDMVFSSYTDNELWAVARLIGDVRPADTATAPGRRSARARGTKSER